MKYSTGTVHHSHTYGCQKCEVKGEKIKSSGMSFPNLDAPLRTNETFRQKTQRPHHKYDSPFEELDIDMVKTFTISDPLHLLHQGVTKKCLQRWTGLPKNVKGYSRKWSKLTTDSVSRYLVEANGQMPRDIHRSLRGLDELSNWKGVEFRTFLMYVGMVVLRPVLEDDEYDHYLLLSCACTIVSCNVYKKYIALAKNMFKTYVKEYINLYGRHTITSNVHNLIHIADDLIENNIDTIDQISTYKYENSLRLLGMKLQTCNRPLEQISRRLIEIFHLKTDLLANEDASVHERIDIYRDRNCVKFSPWCSYELKTKKGCYSQITIKPDVVLSSRKLGDQWFLTRSGDIVKMIFATKVENSYKVCGLTVMSKSEFFSKPIKSTYLNIFKSNSNSLSTELCIHELNSIAAKMLCLQLESDFVFIPILHTLEILK